MLVPSEGSKHGAPWAAAATARASTAREAREAIMFGSALVEDRTRNVREAWRRESSQSTVPCPQEHDWYAAGTSPVALLRAGNPVVAMGRRRSLPVWARLTAASRGSAA